jgi:hypothetical protein
MRRSRQAPAPAVTRPSLPPTEERTSEASLVCNAIARTTLRRRPRGSRFAPTVMAWRALTLRVTAVTPTAPLVMELRPTGPPPRLPAAAATPKKPRARPPAIRNALHATRRTEANASSKLRAVRGATRTRHGCYTPTSLRDARPATVPTVPMGYPPPPSARAATSRANFRPCTRRPRTPRAGSATRRTRLRARTEQRVRAPAI